MYSGSLETNSLETNVLEAWKVSLHGGHSGEFCDHAEGTLREILDAAVAFGYRAFGVSEHAPRLGAQYLYDRERELGWTVAKIESDFARYQTLLSELAAEYADRLTILRGFEAEVVPDDYARIMRGYREAVSPDGRPAFDYMVGSVHFIHGHSIDGPRVLFEQALASRGGLEPLAVEYYHQVAAMIEALRPDVVGHFDLIKLNVIRYGAQAGYDPAQLQSPAVCASALGALEAAQAHNCILDLNTAGWRKGLGEPYPGSAFVALADSMGIPFCFGDDSHRVSEVGAGITQARQYLLDLGVSTITALGRDGKDVDTPTLRRIITLN